MKASFEANRQQVSTTSFNGTKRVGVVHLVPHTKQYPKEGDVLGVLLVGA